MFELHDYHFEMRLRGGFRNDVWLLAGKVYGKPGFVDGDDIFVSTPVNLDGDILTTRSGSLYLLVNPAGNEDEIKAEIKEVIANGSYAYY